MIHLFKGLDVDAALGDPALGTMFADRKRLFVDLLRWDVPVRHDRYEIDQFDGAHAAYLVAIEADGTHCGSMRLLPTTRPHLLSDLFAALCDRPVPTGAGLQEITRLCLPARYPAAERRVIRNALISAMVDEALGAGIVGLTGVVAAKFRDEVLAMGWHAEPLGPARSLGGTPLGAFLIHLDDDTPAQLAAKGIYREGAGTRRAVAELVL